MPELKPHTHEAKDTQWFTASRFGLFVHWGIYALPARGEWIKKQACIPEAAYQNYFNHFDPDLYDPAEWARAARKAGMRYVVITTKHHDGFCLWDSACTDYKVTNTPHGKDLLQPFVEAFRAEGLEIGFYYSLIDWHHPHFLIDRMHPRSPRSFDAADFDRVNAGRDMAIYREYMREQVTELLTQYGEIRLLWFDFSFSEAWDLTKVPSYDTGHGPGPGKGKDDWDSEALMECVRRLQPNCLVNNRLGLPGSGDFSTPEQHQPKSGPRDESGQLLVWEACQTFSGAWGYERDASNWKSGPLLLRMLIDGVSKGGNLLLNVGPNARGQLEPRALDRLRFLEEWMDLHARSIHGCGCAPDGIEAPEDCRLTYNPSTRRLYIHLFAWPFRHLHVGGLKGKVVYAQLLNDASEIPFSEDLDLMHGANDGDSSTLTFILPTEAPPVAVPVIEVFLA